MRHLYFLFILLQISFSAISAKPSILSIFESKLRLLNHSFVKIAPAGEPAMKPEFTYKTFNEWHLAAKKLPYFRKIGSNYTNTKLTTEELNRAVNEFIKTVSSKSGTFAQSALWIDQIKAPKLTDNFFTSQVKLKPVQPFVQKLMVDPNTSVAFRGDLHGDVHSLIEFIYYFQKAGFLDSQDGFKIKDSSNFYMIFLGDYTDRGNYGAEVLYTLMRLKIANPDNVIMVRGNHEDYDINKAYGFIEELKVKFPDIKDLVVSKIIRIYDLLPVALYLGCSSKTGKNFIQCCHGGIEQGFNPQQLIDSDEKIRYQWLGKLNQKTALNLNKKISVDPTAIAKFADFQPTDFSRIGFMWNDFHVDPKKKLSYREGRGFEYSKDVTLDVLNASSTTNNRIRGVFRAHQHSPSRTPMMVSLLDLTGKSFENWGVSKLWEKNQTKNLWDGIVCTFLVAPDTPYSVPGFLYPGFNVDVFGILKTDFDFKDWKLKVVRNKILS